MEREIHYERDGSVLLMEGERQRLILAGSSATEIEEAMTEFFSRVTDIAPIEQTPGR
ncbi:hypothetical protein [Sphingomonas sp. PAMC26645]|uniref:hypothetical protein n=1 Tax=Sphingomonas sp. PAMC26645 TaxID=2565555 RepID=UPI001445A82A|nr:hypothetical protein [Sphingomonas sp. PAMC26645]